MKVTRAREERALFSAPLVSDTAQGV